MKPYLSVKTIYGSSYTCFGIFGELGQVGEIGPKYPKSWTPIYRKSFILLNSTFHIKWSHTYLKSISGSICTCSCVFTVGASQGNLPQIPQVIQSVKFHTPHQVKPYSRLKAILGLSYTCFSIFGELGQVRETRHKYPKSWAPIHWKSLIVLNSTFLIKWSPTQV